MRDLKILTTDEMSEEEWLKFRDEWIEEWTESLQLECEFSKEDAEFRAEHDFEKYCGQEGWAGRNERIIMKREMEIK